VVVGSADSHVIDSIRHWGFAIEWDVSALSRIKS